MSRLSIAASIKMHIWLHKPKSMQTNMFALINSPKFSLQSQYQLYRVQYDVPSSVLSWERCEHLFSTYRVPVAIHSGMSHWKYSLWVLFLGSHCHHVSLSRALQKSLWYLFRLKTLCGRWIAIAIIVLSVSVKIDTPCHYSWKDSQFSRSFRTLPR